MRLFGTICSPAPLLLPVQAEAAVEHAVGALEAAEIVLTSLQNSSNATAMLVGSARLEALADELHAMAEPADSEAAAPTPAAPLSLNVSLL